MGWKEWPQWVRKGIKCALLPFVVILSLLIVRLFNPCGPNSSMCGTESYFVATIFSFGLLFKIFELNVPTFLVWPLVILLPIIIWFTIGAVIGWIIGKIKSK